MIDYLELNRHIETNVHLVSRNVIDHVSSVTQKVVFLLDEDRLSRRKSIVDTVSIQVDILPGNNTEDKV